MMLQQEKRLEEGRQPSEFKVGAVVKKFSVSYVESDGTPPLTNDRVVSTGRLL